jgi:putative protein kinase ArgK-like GTPase of G3E family
MLEVGSIRDVATMLRKQNAANIVGIKGFSGSGKTAL